MDVICVNETLVFNVCGGMYCATIERERDISVDHIY
jgi:hypothetical protein